MGGTRHWTRENGSGFAFAKTFKRAYGIAPGGL